MILASTITTCGSTSRAMRRAWWECPAKVLASDPFSDLAVLKIDAPNLQPATFSQHELRKGQFVIALGNP